MVGERRAVTLGSRGSALALAQTREVMERLTALNAGLQCTVRVIKTQGDRNQRRALTELEGKGLFTKEIEAALLAGEIDLAVHSLKDLPTEGPEGLIVGAVLARADPRDVLVSRLGLALERLPQGARIGTSSLRRAAQLLAYRPDLCIVNLRGNVDTRLRKAEGGGYEAVVLAAAGIIRLARADRITQYIPLDVVLPAPGQGALAVQVRVEDDQMRRLVAALDDIPTRAATDAERAFLRYLGGGCRVPVAAHGVVTEGELKVTGMVATIDGQRMIRLEARGSEREAEALGRKLAERALAMGAGEILEDVRN